MHAEEGIEVHWEPTENVAYLGAVATGLADTIGVPTFAEFVTWRLQRFTPPQKPLPAVYDGRNAQKERVFDLVNQQKRIDYQKSQTKYERERQTIDLLNSYAPDLAGYGAYLVGHYPQVMAFFGVRRPFRILEGSRRLHTYITGGSGSGKSECIKSLLWHYAAEERPTCAVILLDPHGDVALQAAQFKPNIGNGRLAYVDAAYDGRHCPCLNPFDCVADKAALSDLEAEKLADEFLYAFAEILRGDLSDQMRTLLRNTLPVLLKYPDSSVYDLIDFLELPEDPQRKGGTSVGRAYKAAKYKEFARRHYGNGLRVDFLFGQFENDPSFRATRNSLQTRLNLVFGGTMMQTLFRGKRTVRIEELIAARKFAVFNLSPELGTETADTIGRFLLINLKIFALNQAKVPERDRVPVHVFVDEAQRFITPSIEDILSESRKFQVFLTLAQQVVGGGMDKELFRSVRSNTGLKLTGANSADSLKVMADETGTDLAELRKLTVGRFSLWQRSVGEPMPAVAVTMPTNTLKDRAGMSRSEWDRLMAQQLTTYYVRQGATPSIPTEAGEGRTERHGADPLSFDISRHVS